MTSAGHGSHRGIGTSIEPLRRAARRAAQRLGYDVVRVRPDPVGRDFPVPADFDEETATTARLVAPYTLTGPERVGALCDAVRYVVRAGIPGAFVECGVWRGGSALAMVRTLQSLGIDNRDLWLYDTYTHMPAPGPEDVDVFGESAAEQHARLAAGEPLDPAYEWLPLAQVRQLLSADGYPEDRLHFVQGMVEETIPAQAPAQVALLRLDTDYYASTKHELEQLFPRLAPGAVLIVDDYGHWRGSRQAVDEYFAERGTHLLLNRIDYSGRIAVVPDRSVSVAGVDEHVRRA